MANKRTSGNIRGYLFHVVIRMLLEKSGFSLVVPDGTNKNRVRRTRNGLVELRGRGCWHQIDCPCDWERTVPFLPPVRLIGEVRYHMSEIKKESVRNFIGVLTDIREYYVYDEVLGGDAPENQRMEIGVFFAANGFWPEAERLAYSHGVRTVSYKNNRQLERMKELIFELESRYLKYEIVIQQASFLAHFAQMLGGELTPVQFAQLYNLPGEAEELMERMTEELARIATSFFAVTPTGIMVHLLGEDRFPEELFADTDTAVSRVRLEPSMEAEKVYYLQFDGDEQQRKFYFAPPEGWQERSLYGWEKKSEGGTRERVLYAEMKLNGMDRRLRLVMESDWLTAVAF